MELFNIKRSSLYIVSIRLFFTLMLNNTRFIFYFIKKSYSIMKFNFLTIRNLQLIASIGSTVSMIACSSEVGKGNMHEGSSEKIQEAFNPDRTNEYFATIQELRNRSYLSEDIVSFTKKDSYVSYLIHALNQTVYKTYGIYGDYRHFNKPALKMLAELTKPLENEAKMPGGLIHCLGKVYGPQFAYSSEDFKRFSPEFLRTIHNEIGLQCWIRFGEHILDPRYIDVIKFFRTFRTSKRRNRIILLEVLNRLFF
jgi:hypothetical protein